MRRYLSSKLFNLSLLTAAFFSLPICSYSIGIFDQSFGNGGSVVTDLGSDASVVRIDQQPDGKILVVGKNNGVIVLLRYTTNGTLDSTFGVGGKIITSYSSSDTRVSMTIQSNGLFAVGNNSGVTRYYSDGTVNGTVSFPASGVAGFGLDGTIATATLISANGTCLFQNLKVRYNLYHSDGSADASTEFCSGGSGTTGVTSLWGIVPSHTGSFYLGYTHKALNVSNGRVRELQGVSTVGDFSVDFGNIGYSLVDLASSQNNGFVALGYFWLSRQLPSFRFYQPSGNPPSTPLYQKIHGNGKVAALKGNSSLLSLNENHEFEGVENIGPIFGSAVEQSSIYVQGDKKILLGGQTHSTDGYKNIGLVRFSKVIGGSTRTSAFDLDAKSDIAVWRPSTGAWYVHNSSDGSIRGVQFGLSDDKPAPADFDGDGKIDIAIWRPSTGFWYWINSSNNTIGYLNFGTTGDLPVSAYYDTDEFADQAVYRPSTGIWWIFSSSTRTWVSKYFGNDGDIPTIGDFDGDGVSDVALFRPSTGIWYRLNSSGGFEAQQFGIPEDVPVAADYDGDGKTDISVFRPSTGFWYRINSSDNSFTALNFGLAEDKPVPADYDGDGKTDVAVFRPSNGIWYLLRSTQGFTAEQFGVGEDIPIANALLH